MIIDSENFKKKIIDEIDRLMNKNQIPWKMLTEDKLDYMGIVKYSDNVGNKVVFNSIMYRVCFYGKPMIIAYNYNKKIKNESIDTIDMANITVMDNDKRGEIYKLIIRVKEYVENKRKKEDEDFLDRFTLCLNRSKK
ncbi:MAG: hypothetical protein IJ880_15080 [Bacilli bacterium]|nr:hypothetical protein [Bacilli bacterium]